jgi:hypothetical protein
MRLGLLTAGIFLGVLVVPAMADGCGDALDCHPVKWVMAHHHSAKSAMPRHSMHPAARPRHLASSDHNSLKHHELRQHRMPSNYYDYAAAGVVREGYGHGAWHQGYGHGNWYGASHDEQVPMMDPAMPGQCCVPELPPCSCGPTAYGPPPGGYGPPPDAYDPRADAYGPPSGYYPPQPGYDAYAGSPVHIDQGGWTGGVGYGAYSGGGGFVDGYGQVHFANGMQNGPTYNSYSQSFQTNSTGRAGPFVPQRMGGAAPMSHSH